jgi:hypothetical protein
MYQSVGAQIHFFWEICFSQFHPGEFPEQVPFPWFKKGNHQGSNFFCFFCLSLALKLYVSSPPLTPSETPVL